MTPEQRLLEQRNFRFLATLSLKTRVLGLLLNEGLELPTLKMNNARSMIRGPA